VPGLKDFLCLARIFLQAEDNMKGIDAPPKLLMDSIASPKVKTMEGEGVGVRSL
jgi:hypothetical protein